jgi:peroxiredoxin
MARRQEVCGAVSGGILALGLRHGRGEGQDKNPTEETYRLVRKLTSQFESVHGSCICCTLLQGCDLNTPHGQQSFKQNELAQALIEVPLSGPDEAPAMPYFDLARLVRYEGVRTDFTGPQLAKANAILAASDADVEKADFTLNDMKGKKYTFSALRGKVVLVNFWATWCPPCPKELSDLDAVYVRLQSQGLIVLAITPDAPSDLNRFFSGGGVHLPVLLDTDGKVLEEFHVDGLPMTLVFNRKGRLAAKSINVRNQHQFLLMLAKAGLHP